MPRSTQQDQQADSLSATRQRFVAQSLCSCLIQILEVTFTDGQGRGNAMQFTGQRNHLTEPNHKAQQK